MAQNNLKKKTISGMIWSFSDLLANQGIRFIVLIVLARLLTPEDFGLIAMITVIIAVSQSIVDSGLKNALIREKNPTQIDYSTVFYFNLIIAILIYCILFFTSDIISNYLEEPKLTSILKILGLVLIINSIGIIQSTILIRKIDFKTQTKISLTSSLISSLIAVVLAYKGLGVWSLVIQNLLMQLINVTLLSMTNKWYPSLNFSISSFKKLFGFGWKLLVAGLIDTLYKNFYFLIIGKFFTASALGYYTNAQKLRDMASQSVTISLQKVTYPVLSKFKDDKDRLRAGYTKIIKSTVFITFPLMIGLIFIAEPLIILVFGEKWIQSIPYFQLLSLAGLLFPLQSINLNVLQVKGRSDLFLKLEVIKKIISVTIIIIILWIGGGVLDLIWALVLNSVISYFINSYYSSNLLSYSMKSQLKDILPSLIMSFLMGFIVYIVSEVLESYKILPIAELPLLIFVGIITYVILCKVFNKRDLMEFYNLLKSLLIRR